MTRILGVIAVVTAFGVSACAAQGAITYQKGNAIYVADYSGKAAKQIATGLTPGLTPNGQTVIYTDGSGSLFAVSSSGGASRPVAPGLKCPSSCVGRASPDSNALLTVSGSGALDYARLDGSAPVHLANGIYNSANFSPDSSQVVFDHGTDVPSLFTIPVTGGTPTELSLPFGTAPLWTNAGIVATTGVSVGKKIQVRLVALTATGAVARVLQRSTGTVKDVERGKGIQLAIQSVAGGIVTLGIGKKSSVTLRLVSLTGKVKDKRKFKDIGAVQAVTGNGKTILVLGKKGRLQAVNFKSGKTKTLVAKGVKSADAN